MRVTINIILNLVLLLAAPILLQAQATAIMKVSVVVVSGAGIDNVTDMNLKLDSKESTPSNASFTIKNAPNAEVLITYHDKIDVSNEFGDHLLLNTYANIESKPLEGEHQVSFESISARQKDLKGSYKGFLSTTIEYL